MLKKVAGIMCAGALVAGITSIIPTGTQANDYAKADTTSREEVVYVQIEDEKIPLAYTDFSESENKTSAEVDGYEEDLLSAGRIVE